ncbi:MAG TPA: DUF3761 domain-containing protein [Arenimonas sp.]|uniref:DUF3761 domain-containing protein n=1 Tax=Arenimonas sp. TaxID=1872635 RepID=UPI002D7F32A6|nr:DUF3761 domain-containing protein [Arenimonas sp.]HEU0154417.1 DUF3761 domain-containing protein [Arenimonas sp.]
MLGLDSHRHLGPDTSLFSAGGGPALSARQVKAALDAYQVYLDEPLRLADHWRGTITPRDVVSWFHAGCPSDDLVYLIKHDRPAPPSRAQQLTSPTPRAPIDSQPAVVGSTEPVIRPAQHPRAAPAFGDRMHSFTANSIAWVWVWAVYCGLGFGARMFVQGNPELTVWGIGSAAVLALLGGAALVVGSILIAGAMTGRGYNHLRNILVLGVVGLGTIFVASHAYGDAYKHLYANQLAPLAVLVDKCLDAGVRYETYRVGAVCRDGSYSWATGKGACSHHRGVAEWIHPRTQTRTVQQCKQMASETSWLYFYGDETR